MNNIQLKKYMINFVESGEIRYILLDSQLQVEDFLKQFTVLNSNDPNSLIMNVTDLETGKEIVGEVYPYSKS